MSMTIERLALPRLASTLRLVLLGCAALVVWFAALAVLVAALEPEDTVIAFGAEPRLFQAMAASDTLLLANGAGFVRVRGKTPGFVARLYANGAWLVLPGSPFGCGAAGASMRAKVS